MRIVVCAMGYAPAAPGGAERQAQLQAEEMVRRGYQVNVVCPGVSGTSSGDINGVRVTRLPCVPRRHLMSLTYLPMLAGYLGFRVRKADAVMVHLGHYQADVAVLAARIASRPSWVRLAASGPLGEIGRMRRVARLTHYYGLRHATRIQAMSEDQVREAIEIGVLRRRLVQIPNGVDTSAWSAVPSQPKGSARRTLGLSEEGALVLFVGRFARVKGIEDLLEAWRDVDIPGATLVLVGSFNALDSLGSLPPQSGVVVHDQASHIQTYYEAADLLVLPSRASEGMSNVLLEAMACGLPVITTPVGAAAAMITDGTDGILVPAGRPTELRLAIQELLKDPARAEALGEAARRTVTGRYDIRGVMDRILSELSPLLDPAKRQL